MDAEKKKLLINGILVGGIIGSVIFAIKAKPNLTCCMKECYEKSANALNYMNENRSEVVNKLKITTDTFTKVLDETSDDIKAITENIKHIKDNSAKIILSVKDTKEQLAELFQCSTKKSDLLNLEMKNENEIEKLAEDI